MAFLYLTRAVHMPVTADGRTIKNSFGVTIATAISPVAAMAMADLINMGRPSAEEAERRHDADEPYSAAMLNRARKKTAPEECPMTGQPGELPAVCPACGRALHTGCGHADLVEMEG